jgi:hypothetical protein
MTTRILDRRSRSGQIIPLTAVAAGVAIAAIVAFVAIGGGRGDGNSNSGVGAPPATAGPSATPQPTIAPPPDPTPVVTPAPSKAPPAEPTAEPTDDGSDPQPIRVDVETVAGGDVYVDIVDETGFLVGARSGTPAEGQSVGMNTLEVENLDASTLKLSWVDYPIENALALYIFEHEGRLRLLLIQPGPTGPTDTIALDRELILSFSQPISADHVDALLQEGLDTPG